MLLPVLNIACNVILTWFFSTLIWFSSLSSRQIFSPETSTSDATSRLFLQMSLIALQVGQQNAPQKRPSGPSFFGEVFLLGFYIRSPSLGSRFFGKKSNFSRDSVLFCKACSFLRTLYSKNFFSFETLKIFGSCFLLRQGTLFLFVWHVRF